MSLPPLPWPTSLCSATTREKLSPSHREVIAMRFFDDLDYRAIAQITGDSEVALRSRLHDALEKLKSTIKSDK